MNIQDNIKADINSGQQEIGDSNMNNSDIRKIKLNYIQLNKRATTASQGVNRKIPQKQTNEYANRQNGQIVKQDTNYQQQNFNCYEDKPVGMNTMTNFTNGHYEDNTRGGL